jgi:hypothetical protein
VPGRRVLDLLSDFFGCADKAIAFMRRFAGCVLKVPPMPQVERMASDHQIVKVLTKKPALEDVRRMATLHNTDPRGVAKTVSRMTGKGLRHYRKGA